MCGTHSHDGTPIGHHHGPKKRIFHPRPSAGSRRAFLGNLGKGTLAMAVVTPALVACSSDGTTATLSSPTSVPEATAIAPTAAPTTAPTTAPATESAADQSSSETATDSGGESTETLRWARSQLGFVSAYVLARGNTAAIVDTGVAGSATAIGQTLNELGLNYSDVAHVILTHNHGDHAGSIDAVLAEAINATAYAGEADLGPLPGNIVGLAGGEDIFGFEMLATPGHTPGHMAVIDHQAGVLVAGDAIFSEAGGVVEGPERFFDDIPQSRDSIKAMAALTFNTLLVGHGDPIEANADSAVAALAASL